MNRRGLFAAATVGALFFVPLDGQAAEPPSNASSTGSPTGSPTGSGPATNDAGTPAAPRTNANVGLAVLAMPGAGAAAWTLAQSIYATDALRPIALDEAHARVLAGEPAPAGASRDLVDLAETRAAVHGDDAPSRALLASIANTFHLRGIVVVEMVSASHPSARVFVMGNGDHDAEAGLFDAARYEPDAALSPSAPPTAIDSGARDAGTSPTPAASSTATPAPLAAERPLRWTGATTSLARTFAAPASTAASPRSAPIAAPSLATSSVPDAPHETASTGGTPFFKSPWFWGAVGAAAFGTTAIYFATRDNSSSAIHLELQAPK